MIKKGLIFASVLALSACAGTQQLVTVQPDGSKIVDNSFYQQTAFGTDSRINVVSTCNPKCAVISQTGNYSAGFGRAVTTQLAPSVVEAAGFAIGMNNIRPSNTNISQAGGNTSSGSVSGASGGNARATGGTSISLAGANSKSNSKSGAYSNSNATSKNYNVNVNSSLSAAMNSNKNSSGQSQQRGW